MGSTAAIPREFEDWTLMPANTLFGLWKQIGTITVGDDEWAICRSLANHDLILSTTIRHPDNDTATCAFRQAAFASLRRLMAALGHDEEETA